MTRFTPENPRSDFSIFTHHADLVYLDSTATTHKPDGVLDAMAAFLKEKNATVHRGIYGLSVEATDRCEHVRQQVKGFINAEKEEEIIFVKGATEAINLVAHSYGKAHVGKGDNIVISHMEHHANIVPWQQIIESEDQLRVCQITDEGELDLEHLKTLIDNQTKIVALTHVSNVLGTVNPIKECISYIREHSSAKILIDGAQAIAHMPVDVQDLDCDFYCFSGHKMYGPTGIGILYGKHDLLLKMPPYQTGGDMIEFVSFEKTTFAKPPARFEAGTPAIVEIIGLGAAIDYIQGITLERLQEIDMELFELANTELQSIPELNLIGTAAHKSPVFSFTIKGIHSHDVGTCMDQEHVAIRVGHHCAQPLMKRFGVPATARMSFACYNTSDDIERAIKALKKTIGFFI
ncbi:cysteine desulfurase CsdA [Candidatus Marinamargulisbacteria bacterium SCGC AG-343-D04]|nr:cysteine desulfurase CsdA [Candidatus Marinamargulisbacteria bacterium SCGC AG-343-D04]